jgi:hypothetical protein
VCACVSLSETQCKIKIFTNAFLLLHGSRVSNLNVTRYSNAYVLRAARSLALPLSLVLVLNRSQMLMRENYSMPLLSVNSVGFVDVCTGLYRCFDLMRSFCYILLVIVVVCLCSGVSSRSRFVFLLRLEMFLCVFSYYSCYSLW